MRLAFGGAGVVVLLLDLRQHPVAALDARRGGGHLLAQVALVVELEDARGLEPAVARDRQHVDGVGRLVLPLLEPGAGVAHEGEGALVARFHELGGALGGRREVVAHREGQHHEAQAEHQQRAQRAPGAEAAGAQDGVFGALREPRHHEDAADQHGDRQQFVEMARQQQGHVEQRLRRPVGQALGAAHGLQLVDEVEEEEQAQEAEGHEGHGLQRLDVDQAADGSHGVGSSRGVEGGGVGPEARPPRLLRRAQLLLRRVSHEMANSATPPCSSSMKPPMP
ncbi:MAG: hypothetical protein GAK39_06373 [Variovorax sp.]|nr:MAG: hypothetical protein GAK39_06373 [Variovorax sp.]